MTNSKYLYLLLAVVVLIILGGVGYYVIKKTSTITPTNQGASPTITSSPVATKTDETANSSAEALAKADWQTYENKDHGLSFKYPNHLKANYSVYADEKTSRQWIDMELTTKKDKLELGYDLESCQNRDYFVNSYIATQAMYKPSASVEQLLGEIKGALSQAELASFTSSQLTVAGKNALKSSFTLDRDAPAGKKRNQIVSIDILNPANNQKVEIRVCKDPVDLELDQILSTFKFTK